MGFSRATMNGTAFTNPTSSDGQADFLPRARFEGEKQGYQFQNGRLGVGYYRDIGGNNGARPARRGNGNFLEQLEQVEARDVASPGFRPPAHHHQQQHHQQHQQRQQRQLQETPEWARVEQEGLTESKIAYGAHMLPGDGMYAGASVGAGRANGLGNAGEFRGNALGNAGNFAGRRNQLHTSQITFAAEEHVPENERWQRSSNIHNSRAGATNSASGYAFAMPAAGGRSNLAGPATTHGVQNPSSLTSVF